MQIKGKHFLVTGGGSGIGRELVKQLLQRDATVTALDINADNLAKTKEVVGSLANQLTLEPLDISNRDAVFTLAQRILDAGLVIDGVINNAGVIQPFIPISELDEATVERMMKINFFGTYYLTKALLDHLLSRPEAHIANVCSMGGFIPFPGQTAYCASKGAVKMFTEGLRTELLKTNVKVSLFLPGAVNTNIMENSGVEKLKSAEGQEQKILQADDCAKQMLDAIERNKFIVHLGKDAKFLNILYRLFPAWSAKFIAEKMAKR